ncbi:20701_t:CDS:2, partial [Entrophospora sp. SA101]
NISKRKNKTKGKTVTFNSQLYMFADDNVDDDYEDYEDDEEDEEDEDIEVGGDEGEYENEESKIVIKKQNQLEVDANNNNIIIQIQNQAYDGLNFDEDMDRDNGVVYTNLELKNEDVLMTEKKEFKIEDKNFSNSPIENTVNPSTLNNNFVSIDNKTSITSDSSKMQTENNFNNLNINKQVTIDQLISPPLSPEPTRLNSIPNINQQMEQKYNQHFDSNNQPQMAPESTGIISPTNQIELNNNNIQPPNSNTFVLPLPDEPNQNIKASITPALVPNTTTETTESDHPLEIFQSLNSYSTAPLPSIKRSSIASVSSTSSNISNHPKIKNLESNYNENPVTVAFYLNKKISRNSRSSIGDKKLHLRVITYADDLPTHLRSKGPLAPIPRISLSVTKHLADKTARRRSREEGKPREKHLIVNGLTTVADVILKSMKKFGIVDGIVDDGEHIESNDDEIPRYRLMLNIEGNEKLLNPKAGILSEYPTPPNLRHLSIDSLDSASSHALDYLPDEPIFVLRLLKPEDRINRAMPDAIDPKKYMQQSSSSSLEKQMINYNESMNENSDNNDELLKRKQLIEKQREYSRAKQKSIISAHKNTEQGIDIVISDGAIRSSRIFGGSKVRYSFISADGEEIDISDIVEDIMGDDYELVVEEGIDEDPIKEQHQKHQEDSNLTPIDFSNNSSNEESLSSPAPNKKKSYRRSSTQDVDILVKIIGRAQNSNDDERSSQSLDKIGLVIEKVKQTPSYRLSKSNLNPNSDPNFNPNFTQPNSIMSIESENQDTAGSLVYKPNSKTQPFQQTKTRDRSFSNSSVSDFGLKELLMLVRSGVNMLELRERRKSGWHLNEDPEKVLKQIKPTEIKEEIKDIFSDVNQQIDKMEQDLDKLLDDVINTF